MAFDGGLAVTIKTTPSSIGIMYGAPAPAVEFRSTTVVKLDLSVPLKI